VELEVEEHPIAPLHERSHARGPLGREQVAADLEAADGAPQRVGQLGCAAGRIDVERDQEGIHAGSLLGISSVPTRSATRATSWRVM